MMDLRLQGKRVRLIQINDPYTDLKPGDEGTVDHVDDTGTVHVNWDSGATLGVVKEAGDRIEIIDRKGG